MSTDGADPEERDDARIAITYAEVFMLVLLVALAVGAWAWVDLQVASYTKDREPREERVQLAHNLQRLTADLDAAREERKQTDAQLIKARLELHRQNAALAAAQPTPRASPSVAPSPQVTSAPAAAPAGADAEPAANAADRATAECHVGLLAAHQQ